MERVTSERIRGARLLAEGLVVVASILTAFALDAWWNQRAERRIEISHLRGLRSDFEQNVARLQNLIEREERTASASRQLLLVTEPLAEPSSADHVWNLMIQVFNSARFDPVLGAYEAVVSSGGLSQVRDDRLRLALADFASLLEGRYYERYADEIYFDLIRSFTGRLGLTAAVIASDSEDGGPPAVVLQTQRELLRDPKFREHLALRYLAERDITGWYRGLLEKAETVLDLTQRSLPSE